MQRTFLPRWLMVTPDGEPNFAAETKMLSPQHHREIGELATQLVEVVQRDETDFDLPDDARMIWHEWQRQAAIDAYYYGDDIISAVVRRHSTYALKFAMILAATNGSWGTITPEIMETSIKLADNYKVYVGRILSERLNLGVSGAKIQRIHEVVRTLDEGEGVTRRQIMQYAHMRAADLTPCIEKMLEAGALMEIPAKRGKRYVAVGDSLPVKVW